MEPSGQQDTYPETHTACERLRRTMESIRGRESEAKGEVTRMGSAIEAIADATRKAGLECERFNRTREGLASAMSARGTGVRLLINAAHECRSDESPYPRTNPASHGRSASTTVAEWILELRCDYALEGALKLRRDHALIHAERVRVDIETESGDVRVEVTKREGRRRWEPEDIRTDLSEHKEGTPVEGAQGALESWIAGHINRIADAIEAVQRAQGRRQAPAPKTQWWSMRPGLRGWRLIAISGWLACAAAVANAGWDRTIAGSDREENTTAVP